MSRSFLIPHRTTESTQSLCIITNDYLSICYTRTESTTVVPQAEESKSSKTTSGVVKAISTTTTEATPTTAVLSEISDPLFKTFMGFSENDQLVLKDKSSANIDLTTTTTTTTTAPDTTSMKQTSDSMSIGQRSASATIPPTTTSMRTNTMKNDKVDTNSSKSNASTVELVSKDELSNVEALDLTPFASRTTSGNAAPISESQTKTTEKLVVTTASPILSTTSASTRNATAPTVKPKEAPLKALLQRADDFLEKSFKSIKQMF